MAYTRAQDKIDSGTTKHSCPFDFTAIMEGSSHNAARRSPECPKPNPNPKTDSASDKSQDIKLLNDLAIQGAHPENLVKDPKAFEAWAVKLIEFNREYPGHVDLSAVSKAAGVEFKKSRGRGGG
jgi:hypothetical protein